MPGSSTTPGHPSACDDAHGYVAFRALNSVGTRDVNSFVAQWLACTFPCRRFADTLTGACARLGADVAEGLMDMDTLQIDDLQFEVRRSARRRSLEITVDRGGELILSVPTDCPDERLQDFVRRKRMWIYQQLARKEATSVAVRPKEFVDGEGFAYLGRSYRLKLVPPGASTSAVKLVGGRFVMPSTFAPEGRTHLIRWYSDRARPWLVHKVKAYAARMEVDPTGVRVQDLGYRWGSCGKGDWLYFHWKTILLPAPIVEYVVVHEMAHLHEPHHTPAFWRRVERAMPDHERRRGWLESHGLEVEGL